MRWALAFAWMSKVTHGTVCSIRWSWGSDTVSDLDCTGGSVDGGWQNYLGMGSGVIGMGNDTASNGREHISQPASPTGETLPRAQGRPLSIRQQSPARQRENPVTSIQGLIDTIESIPAQVLQLTQQFLTDNAGDENAEQGRSGDNDSDDGCAEA